MCFAIYTRSRFNEYKSKSFKVKSIIKSNRTQTHHILQFCDGYTPYYLISIVLEYTPTLNNNRSFQLSLILGIMTFFEP